MILNFDQVRSITLGVDHLTEEEEGILFHRFTEEQEALYEERARTYNKGFYKKCFCSSGVRLSFQTDSESLFLKVFAAPASTRCYFGIDVLVNGEKSGYLNNFGPDPLEGKYAEVKAPYGEFEKSFDLGEGEKKVEIVFPFSVKMYLKEMRLAKGSTLTPVKRKKKLVAFGDSITHGYDTQHPTSKYITKLCDFLEAEEFNKAIGGEIMFPSLAATKETFVPDYILVAYGSNDWSKSRSDIFEADSKAFLGNLRKNYPEVPVFLLTPIWRYNWEKEVPFGPFRLVHEILERNAKEFSQVYVIDGFDFVDHDVSLFADAGLHPTDVGFGQYYERLRDKIIALGIL